MTRKQDIPASAGVRSEEEEPASPSHLMENMLSSAQFDKKFLEQRKVFLWGPVDDRSARDITNRLLFLDAKDPGKEIVFYINSPGGLVTSGMVIYDTMRMIESPVSTVCMGMAASMGSILLSGGQKGRRFIFPHGEVMIHQPMGGGSRHLRRPRDHGRTDPEDQGDGCQDSGGELRTDRGEDPEGLRPRLLDGCIGIGDLRHRRRDDHPHLTQVCRNHIDKVSSSGDVIP